MVCPSPSVSARSPDALFPAVFIPLFFLWVDAGLLYQWNRKTGAFRSFETSSNRPDDFGKAPLNSQFGSHTLTVLPSH